MQKSDVNYDKSQDITWREPVDKLIDDLVEGIAKSLHQSKFNLNVGLVLKQECEYCQLLPIELRRFWSNPSKWPDIISDFWNRIHEKVPFNNNMRMERLLSDFEDEAKKSVESIGCKGIFYATALKSLKQPSVSITLKN